MIVLKYTPEDFTTVVYCMLSVFLHLYPIPNMFKSFCILNRSEYLKFQISGTFPLLVEWFKDGELLENCQNIQIVNQDDMFLMKVRNTILQL